MTKRATYFVNVRKQTGDLVVGTAFASIALREMKDYEGWGYTVIVLDDHERVLSTDELVMAARQEG